MILWFCIGLFGPNAAEYLHEYQVHGKYDQTTLNSDDQRSIIDCKRANEDDVIWLRFLAANIVKHGVCDHGTAKEGQAARETLKSCKGTSRWASNNRKPQMSVAEFFDSFAYEQMLEVC